MLENPLILGPTDDSLHLHPQGCGEMTNARSLQAILGGEIHDIHHLLRSPDLKTKLRQIQGSPDRPIIVIAYHSTTTQLLETGATESIPTIARLLAFEEEAPLPRYDRADLILTPNTFTRDLAIDQGQSAERLITLPYQVHPDLYEFTPDPTFRESYLTQLAQKNNKPLPNSSKIIGCAARFLYHRNVDLLIRAFQRLQPSNSVLLLKGNYDNSADYMQGEGYTERLRCLIESVQEEPWFFLDEERQPSQLDAWQLLNLFDVGVHLGGTQDPPNVILELIALGKPLLLLNLRAFRDYPATFISTAGYSYMRRGTLLSHTPDLDAIIDRLKAIDIGADMHHKSRPS